MKMTEVILHIYDVTNSGSDKTNSTILQINRIFKDGIGLGGIFHSAVQVSGCFRRGLCVCMYFELGCVDYWVLDFSAIVAVRIRSRGFCAVS